ncbi:hypothetical protein ABFY54_28995 [Priestia megaterium]|uniref:hypothetical protein n=1 Tax=Priestia megaterium TaxID=1404 RepID=UPI003D2A6F38
MIIQNNSAKKVPKKNLFNVDGGNWENRTGTGVLNLRTIDQYFTSNPVRITAMFLNPLVEGIKTYSLSWNSAMYNIAIAEVDANGIVVADFGWKLTPSTYTFKSNAKYFTIVVSHKSATNISTDEAKELNFQMEVGTVATAYEPYSAINKASNLIPKKNLLFPYTEWTISSNVSKVTLNPTNASFYSTQAWSGLFSLTPLEANTTYTFSFESNEFTTDSLQFYARFIDDKGVQLGGAWPMHRDKTFTTPAGTVKAKITAEPTTLGINKQLSIPRIQLEKGSVATDFELYKLVNKRSKSKNLFNPDTVTKDKFVRYFTGELGDTTAGNVATDFIPVLPNTLYSSPNSRNAQNAGTSFYDKNKVFISGVQTSSFTTPPDCFYLRTTVNSSDIPICQIEKGSPTSYVPFRDVKKVKPSIPKAIYRNYPFIFNRSNIEIWNGVQYGVNNPRIKNGGILLEEYVYNLLSGKTFLPNNPTTIVDKGDYYLVTAGSTSNFQGIYLTGITVKAMTTYTLSAKFEELGSAIGKLDFVIEQTGGTTIRKKPVKSGDRYSMTFTTGSGVTRISTCFYLSNGVIGDTFTLSKDIQLEERSYPTTPANGFRQAENLQIPVAFDTQGGSIEIEFDYHYCDGATQYLFDTNPEERWLIYKETYDSWIVYTNGVSRGYLSKKPIEGRNNIKLSWTATDFTLILNGEQVAGKAHSINGQQNRIFLGQRYTIGSHLDDVIYSVVIKDHNGNITYQF